LQDKDLNNKKCSITVNKRELETARLYVANGNQQQCFRRKSNIK